MKFTCPVGRNL